ncbi:MAG: CopG family transcriptional regulator [Halorientalis sp.]
MASESTDESVTVSLPPELAAWVDEQATDRGTDRETVLAELLAAHRTAADLDAEDSETLAEIVDVEAAVDDVLADRLPDVAEAVADRLEVEAQVQSAVERHLQDALEDRLADLSQSAADRAAERVQDRLDDRIEAVEDDYMEKIQDVRQRVVQVKQETDGKAPADHDHPDLVDRVDALAGEIESVEDEIETLRSDFDERTDDNAARLDDLTETTAELEEKLRTVAHVVRDLRDESRMDSKHAASVDAIKRRAAELDVDRAKCGVCGEGVEIGLMTDPECPHCEAVVTDVQPKDGFFDSPKLVEAKGIEAPEETDG